MKSANNWEGSLTTLGNTWTDIVGNFVNSDSVITFLKSLNGALSLVNTTTEKLGSLGTIGTVGAGAGLFAFFKNLDQLCCKFCLENLCRSNIGKEMIRWFKVQVYMFGSSININQRGVIDWELFMNNPN